MSKLTDAETRAILTYIYYLNMQELRSFCDEHAIPYLIRYEAQGDRIVKTRDGDRKAIVIDRILHFVNTGTVKPPTVFRLAVVRRERGTRPPVESERVYYGQYKNTDSKILALMKRLTSGEFEFGAIAQEVIRDYWTRGEAPTYTAFAKLWMRAKAAHTEPNPEWAFLTDRSKGTAGPDWKKLRTSKASRVIALLNKAAPAVMRQVTRSRHRRAND